jgi:hypothetical protein
MERISRWMVLALILMVGAALVACNAPAPVHKEEPAHVEPIEGTDLSRITLTERAAERIAIETVPLVEEQVVRKRAFGGRVVDTSDSLLVRVALNASDLNRVDRSQPAVVRSLDEGAKGFMVPIVEAPDPAEESSALYCRIDSDSTGLVLDQAVFVEVSMVSPSTQQKVIPYAAVLYDLNGDEWVYTSPQPLVYVRAPIVVDYIDGDLAVLSEGPPADTEVVTAGASELFGAEAGIGGH